MYCTLCKHAILIIKNTTIIYMLYHFYMIEMMNSDQTLNSTKTKTNCFMVNHYKWIAKFVYFWQKVKNKQTKCGFIYVICVCIVSFFLKQIIQKENVSVSTTSLLLYISCFYIIQLMSYIPIHRSLFSVI